MTDVLNQGEPGSTKWNRTTFGKINARNVHRSLNGILQVQLDDVELASICFDCEISDGLKISKYLEN